METENTEKGKTLRKWSKKEQRKNRRKENYNRGKSFRCGKKEPKKGNRNIEGRKLDTEGK